MELLIKMFEVQKNICHFVVLIVLCAVSNILSAGMDGWYDAQVYQKSPIIYLSGYTEADSVVETAASTSFTNKIFEKNDFVWKRFSDYFVYSETVQVSFVCESNYPIKWTFPFLNQLPTEAHEYISAKEKRLSNFNNVTGNVKNSLFENKITLKLKALDFLSLNLTCQPADPQFNFKSSIHVFLQGRDVLEHERETVHVNYSAKDSSSLIIPCRPNSPELKLSLARRANPSVITPISSKDVWHSLTSYESTDIFYDPKIGFKLKNRLGKATFVIGIYQCMVDIPRNPDEQTVTNEDAFVYFNVTAEGPNEETDQRSLALLPKNYTRGFASFSIIPDSWTCQAQFCSGVPMKSPNLFVRYCTDPLNCQLLAYHINGNHEQKLTKYDMRDEETGCSRRQLYKPIHMVTCKADTVTFANTFINLFHPLANGPVYNRSNRVGAFKDRQYTENDTIRVHLLTEYKAMDNVTINQKVAIFVGKFRRRRNLTLNRAMSLFPSEKFEDYSNPASYYQSLPSSIVQVKEYDRDVHYEGEPLLFFCIGVKYFYAQGAKLFINWKNGTKSLLPDPPAGSKLRGSEKLVYFNDNAEIFNEEVEETETIFRDQVIANQNMSSVECWMPLSQSDQWDKFQKPLRVLPSVAPKFLGPENETVYVYLGEKGKPYDCSIVEAKPFPYIKVLWNGQRIGLKEKLERLKNQTKVHIFNDNPDAPFAKEYAKLSKNLIEIELNFKKKIQLEHHGMLQCIAKNVNKTVTRTVRVIVIERTSWALPVSLSVVLIALLLAFGLLYLKRKRNIQVCRTWC